MSKQIERERAAMLKLSKQIERERAAMLKQIESEKRCLANPRYPNIRLVNRSELPQSVQDTMNSAVVPINVELSNLRYMYDFYRNGEMTGKN
jgi:hypothetical protein